MYTLRQERPPPSAPSLPARSPRPSPDQRQAARQQAAQAAANQAADGAAQTVLPPTGAGHPTAAGGAVAVPSDGAGAPAEGLQGTAAEDTLTPSVAVRMLRDDKFDPGPRPSVFDLGASKWLFKESGASRKKRGVHDDRWRNSGGAKGARNLPAGGPPLIRRRYGAICKSQNAEAVGLRYHEYTLLEPTGGGQVEENRSVIVFHVIPPPEFCQAAAQLPAPTQAQAEPQRPEPEQQRQGSPPPAAAGASAGGAAAAPAAAAGAEAAGGDEAEPAAAREPPQASQPQPQPQPPAQRAVAPLPGQGVVELPPQAQITQLAAHQQQSTQMVMLQLQLQVRNSWLFPLSA